MVHGLKFPRSPTSGLEGDEFQSTDTYNNSICTYKNSEDEEVMKMSKRTRTSLKMHKPLSHVIMNIVRLGSVCIEKYYDMHNHRGHMVHQHDLDHYPHYHPHI